jgi:hypothetical protein
LRRVGNQENNKMRPVANAKGVVRLRRVSILAVAPGFVDGSLMIPAVAAGYRLCAQCRDLCREFGLSAQICGSAALCRRERQDLGRLAMRGRFHRPVSFKSKHVRFMFARDSLCKRFGQHDYFCVTFCLFVVQISDLNDWTAVLRENRGPTGQSGTLIASLSRGRSAARGRTHLEPFAFRTAMRG